MHICQPNIEYHNFKKIIHLLMIVIYLSIEITIVGTYYPYFP